jgi:1,5-anhydro-D-fructose reductase (1,5-anhydro-D-mannitol-forming)
MRRVGVIGSAGKMGIIRLNLFAQLHDCKVVALCDTHNSDSSGLPFSNDPFDVIRNPNVDAVCICTPNYMIKDLVVAALDQKKHVFCEKPPGVSLSEVAEMKAALARNPGLKLKFGFNHRYHDAIMEAKKSIDTGDFGKILWMRGRYGKSVDDNFQKSWRAKKELAGGGILLDQGIHMLDLFLHFCGNFEEVGACCDKQYWGLDIEDNVFAILRNSKGQTASLHSTMTQWRHLFSLEIFLERGYMVINGILSASGAYKHNGGEELTIALNRTPAPQAAHTREQKFNFKNDFSFKKEVDEFINCIRNDLPVRVGNINDAETLMALVEKIYASDIAVKNPKSGASTTDTDQHKTETTTRSQLCSPNSRFSRRMTAIRDVIVQTEVTNGGLCPISIDHGFEKLVLWTKTTTENGGTLYIIGNGASASMASHIAADLCKNGKVRAHAFSDISLLTALANDIGAADIFSTPVERFGKASDMLIAISSSGSSPNIINAVNTALEKGMKVITFSGLKPANPLRTSGHINFYTPAATYGNTETCHAALLHYWVDLIAGDIPCAPAIVPAAASLQQELFLAQSAVNYAATQNK